MFKRFMFGRRQSTLTFNVLSLDGTILTFDLESRSTGNDVLDRVMEANGIQGEREYFGLLSPTAEPQPHWLVLTKPLKKQLPGRSPYTVNLRVCMYPRDHQSITQPSTRHLLYLQVKQDMYSSRLSCSDSELLYKIAGLALQSEIGDFSAQRCGLTYVSDFELIPVLTRSTEESISHLHRLNRGRASSDCDQELLDIVQDLATYGTISYNVQDSSRQNVTISVSPSGVKVQQRTTERASFEWDSIERITTRGKGVTFHISATHTLAPYQVQYTCPSSSQAQNIASHCQYLLESYCVPVAEAERPKSRLKRWFSSRRSFRRRPSPMRRHLKENGHNRRVLNGRRASFGGDLTSGSSLNTVTASSRMSLRASSRSDSKLVIYGAGGLASQSQESVQMPSNHHTLQLELNDAKAEQLGATPLSRGSGASPPPRSMGATPPLRGSVADVEHKSVSSLLKGHTPHNSSSLHHRHISGTTSNRKSSNSSTNVGEGERRRSYVQEVGSPVKSLVFIDREEQGRHGNHFGSLRQSTSTSQSSLPQSPYDYNKPPPKVEWYHSDVLKSPSHEGEKSQPWYMDNMRSPGHSQHETSSNIRASYHELGRGRADSVQSQPAYDQSSSSLHHYQRHNSVEHKYRHSSSVERFQHQASASAGSSGNNMKRFYHSQSVDHIENRDTRDSRDTKHRHHRHHHHHHHHRHHHSGGRTRSTRSSSDLTERQNIKSSSLTRDTPPRLQEEDEPEGQSSLRYVDGNHPSKPQNRGQYRLSLPESSYYDNGNRPINRHGNARRSRKALSNTGFTSTGSLSQPADLGLGLSSKLGSIASLEYQASLAELSQTDVSSVIDPHTRSFIFEGSQTNSQGTVL